MSSFRKLQIANRNRFSAPFLELLSLFFVQSYRKVIQERIYIYRFLEKGFFISSQRKGINEMITYSDLT